MQAISTQKHIRMSPRKLRLVVNMVKHMTPSRAVEVLPFMNKRAALPLQKVIKTAIANAKVKGAEEQSLVFAEIQIGEGPRLKRYRAGSRGRYKPYTHDMAHIRVVVTDEQKEVKNKKKVEKVAEVVETEEIKPVEKKAVVKKARTKKGETK